MNLRVAATVAPSPSRAFVLGDMQGSLLRQTGLVKIVRPRLRVNRLSPWLSTILRASAKRRRRRELACFEHDRQGGLPRERGMWLFRQQQPKNRMIAGLLPPLVAPTN